MPQITEELILASTSPYRRRMLTDAGIAVRCEAPGVDERAIRCDTPERLARELARRKAEAVAARFPGRWVLGADQVVFDPDRPDEPIGKPADPEDHLRRLRALVGGEQVLVTAFTLLGGCASTGRWGSTDRGSLLDSSDMSRRSGEPFRPGTHQDNRGEISDAVSTRLSFRGDLTDEELRAYVATGEGAGCAGGYAVEGRGAFLVERIEGDLFNVIGLPLLRVITALRALGWRFPSGSAA